MPMRQLIFGAQITLTAADFEIAQVGFVPLSLRDVQLQKSDVEWSDIGGKYFNYLVSYIAYLIRRVERYS